MTGNVDNRDKEDDVGDNDVEEKHRMDIRSWRMKVLLRIHY